MTVTTNRNRLFSKSRRGNTGRQGCITCLQGEVMFTTRVERSSLVEGVLQVHSKVTRSSGTILNLTNTTVIGGIAGLVDEVQAIMLLHVYTM